MKKSLLALTVLFALELTAQSRFVFHQKLKKQDVSFKLINNLIVFPLEINGQKLSFILDTGVNKTILFSANNDSLKLKSTQKVFIHGLGAGEPLEALRSRNNHFKIAEINGYEQELYVITDDAFQLSSKMGTTIHGIIGFDLLKDVVVRVNYSSERLTFYKPITYKEPRCRSCEKLPITFDKNKPFINASVKLDSSNIPITVKMLVDSGGSDALWLFEGTGKNIKTPSKFFIDILGEGLSGTIYGKRSRIRSLSIGKYEMPEPTASFLDTLSTLNARRYRERNGSIGGEVLKRFKVWIDYPNNKLMLKKNASLKRGFFYNMSGLHVVYNGLELVKEKSTNLARVQNDFGEAAGSSNKTISFVTSYNYRFKPSFKVDRVAPGSPAALAGIQQGDLIKKINGKLAHEFTLEEIMEIFHSKPKKKIVMIVERGVMDFKYKFRLEKRI